MSTVQDDLFDEYDPNTREVGPVTWPLTVDMIRRLPCGHWTAHDHIREHRGCPNGDSR
ncbi:hypothetical protein [Pimelobacter simplex]|uniref:hypothetical protein n=1 Tax=Nocardioides simplex TaxID=2045 RepID=UPI003AACEAEA